MFVAPTTPADRGNGLAMRAGVFLDALATSHDVSLLVVPVAGPAPDEWPPFVRDRTTAQVCLRHDSDEGDGLSPGRSSAGSARTAATLRAHLQPMLSRVASTARIGDARRAFDDRPPFDLVVVMRLYLAPFVTAFTSDGAVRPRTMLDLDDDEVSTRMGLAAMWTSLGERARSEAEAIEAERYRAFEGAWLPAFDRVLVCADGDRAVVRARTGHRAIDVVPNGIALPDVDLDAALGAAATGPVRLLFVGSLGYAPNTDAVIRLCREIAPALRERIGRAVQVDLVGSRPPDSVRALGDLDGVTVHADVPDVAPYYRRADLVVAPIRAGGGTRVKLLEAFAHGVPVVATSTGAAGLDVVSGRQLLIADDPAAIVAACERVISDPDLARRLRSSARALVSSTYETSIVARRIRQIAEGGATDATSTQSAPRHDQS